LGLPWLYTWGSGRFVGVGRDAEFVSKHIAATFIPSTSQCSTEPAFHSTENAA
jgi:putative flavoprotein involved in K+ transport